MTTGEGLLIGGAVLVAGFVVYRIAKGNSAIPSVPVTANGGTVPAGQVSGSSTGTGTSSGITPGSVASKVATTIFGNSFKSAVENTVAYAVVGTPYLAYKGITTVASWL